MDLECSRKNGCAVQKDGKSASVSVFVFFQQDGGRENWVSSGLQHFCMSDDFADQNCNRKSEFSMDSDGGGVSAEAAGDFSGAQPHREGVQTHDAAGAFVWDERRDISHVDSSSTGY